MVADFAERRSGVDSRRLPCYCDRDAHPDRAAAVRIQRAPRAGTRLVSGIDGTAVFDTLAGLDKLALQISRPVQWASCLASCVEAGARVFFELGPGHALADMAAGSYPGTTARGFNDFRSLQGVRAWLQRTTADG